MFGLPKSKAMNERQPRRKWDLVEEIRRLKEQLKGWKNKRLKNV